MDKRKEVLIRSLKDTDEAIRKLAAEALEMVEIRDRMETIEKLINQGEKVEKLRAVYALGKLKGQKVIQLLLKAVKDPIEDVRAAAIRALGNMGDPRVMSPLTECLSDNSYVVKRVVVEALGSFKDPRLTG